MQPYVAYYRVSTQKQGQSGLGLEAQRNMCAGYNPIAEFIEVESGKHDDRPELAAAMELARKSNATLVIAKLDRLSRNASFILQLMERGVRIRCADMPDADEFQLHLYAILAHKERKMISERTKAALQAAKARGVSLGGTQESTRKQINAFDTSILNALETLCAGQHMSMQAKADALNSAGYKTRKGSQFNAMQIKRILDRK